MFSTGTPASSQSKKHACMSARLPTCGDCRSKLQVADLDDEFAELLLTNFSDNFDAVPFIKVSLAPQCKCLEPRART